MWQQRFICVYRQLQSLICFFFLKQTARFLKNLINLFLGVLGLHCCVQAFSSCDERGLLLVAELGLLIVVVFLAEEHRL